MIAVFVIIMVFVAGYVFTRDEGVSTFTSLGVIAVFVIIMVFVAGYVFTREATKPF